MYLIKELKFTTSKGTFLIIDDKDGVGRKLPYDLLIKIGYLKNLTELQASEIVDKVMGEQHFQNYNFKSVTDRWCKTAIESLHSLLKSKGIHLFENPIILPDEDSDYPQGYLDAAQEEFVKTEQKTFYNPYIFKIDGKI